MLRSLVHYWRVNLAVVLGAAVATSVLAGALLVGDSVRGSLRALTLGRLGAVDHAIIGAQPFRDALLDDLLASGDLEVSGAAPLLSVKASIRGIDSGFRANNVTLFGVDDRFGALFGESPVETHSNRLRVLHANGPLMQALGSVENDAILVTVQSASKIHREFLFGEDDADDQLIRRRLRLGKVASDAAGGRFSFEPNQAIPMVGFVSLRGLQNLIGAEGKANGILLDTEASVSEVVSELSARIRMEDYGLSLRISPGIVSLETERFLLPETVSEAARKVGDSRGFSATAAFTYLANALVSGDRSIPYTTVTAVAPWSRRAAPPQLVDANGTSIALPDANTILLNNRATERLGVTAGDSVTLRYYEVDADESFIEDDVRLVAGTSVQIAGLGGDRTLTPDFPGLQEADNMADWDAPFPVDYDLITDADEAYWDEFGATPRAFISLEEGQRLWSSRFGTLTSIRFHVSPSANPVYVRSSLISGLRKQMSPESQGIQVVPLRERGMSSARGATDFSGLFFGFNMFLVASGLILISQLFHLSVLDRRSEFGMLKALGYTSGRVLRRAWAEGALLAGAGVVLGLVGAVLYARLMIHGLSTWWIDAVGTRLLTYHGESVSLTVGAILSFALVIWLIRRTVKSVTRETAIGLLKGGPATVVESSRARVVYRAGLGLTLVSLVAGLIVPDQARAALFFVVGACGLTTGVSGVRLWLDRGIRRQSGLTVAQLTRFPVRAMASVTLVALSIFVLVSVGLSRNEGIDEGELPTGAGGLAWVAEATSPIVQDLTDVSVREELGLESNWAVHAFRLKPGEDISCLNLHRPGQPRILGTPPSLIARGGFPFQSIAEGVNPENPWEGLRVDLGDDVIPAIGDFNSVMWILHSGLGQEIVVQDELGQPVRLKFVALLQGSVLQSEILISEEQFVSRFPSIEGHAFMLLDAPPDREVEQSLEQSMDRFGVDVVASSFRLAQYRAVENTYMATFQLVGGLGILLGTIGVGVLMLRNVVERRGEFAGMRALGFTQRRIGGLVFGETSAIVMLGVAVGGGAGIVAVAPSLVERGGSVPWVDLGLTVGAVCLAGVVSAWGAARFATRAPIVTTLKLER